MLLSSLTSAVLHRAVLLHYMRTKCYSFKVAVSEVKVGEPNLKEKLTRSGTNCNAD